MAGYAFHVGALAGLADRLGWDAGTAELIVGTSSGSIVAAGLRAGLSPADLRQRAHDGGDGDTDDPLHLLVGAAGFRLPDLLGGPSALGLVGRQLRRGRRAHLGHLLTGLLPEGRVATGPLHHVIDPLHPDGWPTEPLWITATDQQSGRLRVFGRSGDNGVSVATAVQASCAVPGFFAPVTIDDRAYIDGGINSPDNLEVVADQDLDVVIVSSPLSIDTLPPARSPLLRLLRLYPRRQLRSGQARLQASGTRLVMLEPDLELARALGVNAMAAGRLQPVLEATGSFIERWLAGLAPVVRDTMDGLVSRR